MYPYNSDYEYDENFLNELMGEGDFIQDNKMAYNDVAQRPPFNDFPYGNPQHNKPRPGKPPMDRPPFDRPDYDRPNYDRPNYDRPDYDKPNYDRPNHDRPPTGKPPIGRPPEHTPQRNTSLLRIDPQAIRQCNGEFTYIWLKNGRSFWIYPTYIGRNSLSGYRWSNYGWVYFGLDLDSIESFYCIP